MSGMYRSFSEAVPVPRRGLTEADVPALVSALAEALIAAVKPLADAVKPPEPTTAELAAMDLETRDIAVRRMAAARFDGTFAPGGHAAVTRAWGDFVPRTELPEA